MQMFKSMKALRTISALLSLALVFNACKKDDPLPLAPTLTAGAATNGKVGDVVKITATLNAPGGLKTLTVLKNGQVFESKAYAGETTAAYTKDYTVEALPVNSVVTFTFQATDNSNQTSTLATQVITVSAIPAKQIVEVKGVLEGNISWTKDKIYKLVGFVRLGEDLRAQNTAPTKTGVLTIQAGTVIIGDRASKATLVIQRGSQIIANGTLAEPIVFTSERAVGEREAGDWGGLVICGRALTNIALIAQGVGELEGSYSAFYGGSNPADNSGSLKYVRVEYAGIPINPNQEVNSFTFGSVGSGTTMEYLQASFGGDDSFEWFGGSANAKYLVAYRGLDDDFDIDNGFSGSLQFGIGIRGATIADQSGSNGFEIDNDGGGTANTPITAPIMSNFSLIGAKENNSTAINPLFQNGMHIRRGPQPKIFNTFVTGYPNGIFLDPTGSVSVLDNASRGTIVMNNVVVSGVAGWGTNNFGAGAGLPNGFSIRDVNTAATPVALPNIGTQRPSVWFAAQPGNKLITDWITTGISATLFSAGRPMFTVGAGANTLTTGGTTPAGAFFTATDFVGAFKTTDWTAGWANFAPQTTDYSK